MSSAKRLLQVGVAGAAKPRSHQRRLAREVGRLLGEEGVAVVCGGLSGVMEEVCRGARERGGLTIGLLPGTVPGEANPYVQVVLPTGLGELRNGLLVRSCGALIAIGEGYGTLSEIALARRSGVSCVLLESFEGVVREPPLEGAGGALLCAGSAAEAVSLALEEAAQRWR